jgi:prephenate dehydratase
LRVAFLGPEGTFSEEALFAVVDAEMVEPVPLPTIYDCVIAVQQGEVDRAFVPIENSLEGSVDATLDSLVFEAEQVAITGEVVRPIQHSLIARGQLSLDQIERVLSHPQASGQCARFLREHLPQAEVVAAPSTADAVRIVADSDASWAALGTQLAAEINNCEVLLKGVEDHPENETRFVWLEATGPPAEGGRASERVRGTRASEEALPPEAAPPEAAPPEAAPARQFKTSVVFWGLPDAPGSLVEILKEFAERGVNLSKIESRPLKQGLGRYLFLADLTGAITDPPIEAALEAVEQRVGTLRVLGSYPAAGQAGATG